MRMNARRIPYDAIFGARAIPATTDWKQWTDLYELIPWDNSDDLGHLLRLIASEQNSKNWTCRVLRNVDFDECDATTAGDANEEQNLLLKKNGKERQGIAANEGTNCAPECARTASATNATTKWRMHCRQ